MDQEENILLTEMIQKQIKDVPLDKKLYLSDIQRILKNINSSIFEEKKCCLWTGYVTNLNKSNKGTYINFYFQMCPRNCSPRSIRTAITTLHPLCDRLHLLNLLTSTESCDANCLHHSLSCDANCVHHSLSCDVNCLHHSVF